VARCFIEKPLEAVAKFQPSISCHEKVLVKMLYTQCHALGLIEFFDIAGFSYKIIVAIM
jgi:hypothetical protein